MSYTNRIGKNPSKLSNDIEIRSWTNSTAESISDEYRDTLWYEPGVGTLYISTWWDIFIHSKSWDDANTWRTLVEGDPQPDIEVHSASINLSPDISFWINSNKEVNLSLVPSMTAIIV